MKRVLVTGATGFIGRVLCRRLLALGCDVTGTARSARSEAGISLLQGDLADVQPFKIAPGTDTVFHLAGKAHALSATSAEDASYFQINTEGTRRVLEAARMAGVKRFVLFSSIKAMTADHSDSKAVGPRTEEQGGNPDTPYGQSKLQAEQLALHGGYVAEPVVLRLCMVYGAGAKGNLTQMIRAVQAGRFPPLPEAGNKRSMVHVEDVVVAAILAAEHSAAVKQTYIVADDEAYSTRQVYDAIRRALDLPVPNWSVPLPVLRGLARTGDAIGKLRGRRFAFDSDALEKLTGDAWFSPAKIQRELGFKPHWNLERALPAMVREALITNGQN